jgi:osmotically-inducible protein OsmY
MIINHILLVLMILLLQGCLPTLITATSATAVFAVKDTSLENTITDTRIFSIIETKFVQENFKSLYSKINVTVNNSRVLLTGTVASEEEAMLAIKLAWDNEYVKEVINELKINKNNNRLDIEQYTKDCMITAQAKSKLLFKPHLKSMNYTIITINDIVYIFGLAKNIDDLQEATSIISRIKGVDKVVVHTKIMSYDN